MSGGDGDGVLKGLLELGSLLEAAGLRVRGGRAGGRPCLAVSNPGVARMSEAIFAGRDGAGPAWFWWSWGERIVPVDEPEKAAAKITRVLT